jgi:hypothetical protein
MEYVMVAPAGSIAKRKGDVFAYLTSVFPNIVNNRKVWDAFKWATGNDGIDFAASGEKWARFLVNNGVSPEVHPTSNDSKDGRRINGVFYHATPRRIYIHTRVLNAYVHKLEGAELLLESTVLHELVHFSRFWGSYPRKINDKEAGKEFERRAYGRDVNLKNMGDCVCGACGH